VTLTKHEMAGSMKESLYGGGQVHQYSISGLPPGEHAIVAEFPPYGWRILRWNDEWHGNWTGAYVSADAAIAALREELLRVVA
jgi:hypothetical protein